MNHIKPLRDLLYEQVSEEPYQTVCFYHTGDPARDFANNDHIEMINVLRENNPDIIFMDYFGTYISYDGDDTYLNYLKIDQDTMKYVPPSVKKGVLNYSKPLKISKENTLILYRDLAIKGRIHWKDMIKRLGIEGFYLLNSIECYDICGSKHITDVYLKQNNIKTPKTVRILHSEDTERAFNHLDTKFPVILKMSVGSQTGVGVVLIDNMRTLHATVQMALLVDKQLPLLLQEYIEIDYDIRAIVLGNEVIASMKRKVIKGTDFRSNVSLGAEAEAIELTDLEKEIAVKSSNAVKGKLTGVDMFASSNRETEEPFVLEVNANPGFVGIEKVVPTTTQRIFDHFKDRNNWT